MELRIRLQGQWVWIARSMSRAFLEHIQRRYAGYETKIVVTRRRWSKVHLQLI